tara:strand:- start:556 stop:780 length:225 start_codon:yes stop_codon:yes gene_type:complete
MAHGTWLLREVKPGIVRRVKLISEETLKAAWFMYSGANGKQHTYIAGRIEGHRFIPDEKYLPLVEEYEKKIETY